MSARIETNKYQLAAREGREYSADSGWEFTDQHIDCVSEYFETKEAAIAYVPTFIESLKASKDDVYEINLNTFTWGEDEDVDSDTPELDIETLDIIDLSDKLSDYTYVVYEYFGNYMLPQGKYKVEYTPNGYATLNELLKVCEHSSFNWWPTEAFKTKDEVIEAMKGKRVVGGVISELFESED